MSNTFDISEKEKSRYHYTVGWTVHVCAQYSLSLFLRRDVIAFFGGALLIYTSICCKLYHVLLIYTSVCCKICHVLACE
jgi:hypothetical protein